MKDKDAQQGAFSSKKSGYYFAPNIGGEALGG